MPNKKQQRNPYFFFMKDLQAKYASHGERISMKNISELANPLWKGMSLAEKEKYEILAKSEKTNFQAYGRLASDGTSILENLAEEERKEEIERQMRQGITDLLRVPGVGDKAEFIELNSRKKFYFVTFNVLCFVEGGTYIPIEVGVTEYSIKDGMTADYHRFIYPGPIPKGYTGEAKRHGEATHLIPLTGHEDSEKDYRKIWQELMDFLSNPACGSEIPPPVFCLKEAMYQTLGCLEWLAIKADAEECIPDLKVWDASYLLMEMRSGVDSAVPSYAIAADLLKKNAFDYITNTRCYFHENLDNIYCALGYARRLCYLLSDAVCQLFGVEATEKHLPLRAMARKTYETHIPSFASLSLSAPYERGIGRGVTRARDNPGSRTESNLHSRLQSRLSERTEPNSYAGINSAYSSHEYADEPESSVDVPDSDTENRLPVRTTERSVPQLRQPVSMSMALSLARAAQAPAVVPGKGIGRGQGRP